MNAKKLKKANEINKDLETLMETIKDIEEASKIFDKRIFTVELNGGPEFYPKSFAVSLEQGKKLRSYIDYLKTDNVVRLKKLEKEFASL